MNALLDRVAGAPITWGVCEVPGWGHQLAPERVLGEMAGIGLRATELGPDGYLPGEPGRLRDLLSSFGLGLAGGFLPVVLHRSEAFETQLEGVSRRADLLAAVGSSTMVLAAASGEPGYGRSVELDADAWTTLARSAERVVEIAAERGVSVALHPHVGTAVERPEHVTRVLETTSVGLCLDTGHLAVGGSDPVELATSAGDRVAHVHLKDVSIDLAARVRAGSLGYREAVRLALYRPLGEGDLDVAAIVGALERTGYGGWYVLEQDAVLEGDPEDEGPVAAAAASLAFLRRTAREVGAQAR